MFFCAKKIVYLSLYEGEERMGSAGFAGIYGEKEEVRITLQIKTAEAEGTCPVRLILRGQEIAIGEIELKKGCGTYERRFAMDREGMMMPLIMRRRKIWKRYMWYWTQEEASGGPG